MTIDIDETVGAVKAIFDVIPAEAEPETYFGTAHVYREDENVLASVYLGPFDHFDPCGCYHHILSQNGLTEECIEFWDSFDQAFEAAGMSLETGNNDPTDVYITKHLRDID